MTEGKESLAGTEDKETALERILKLIPWIIAIFLLVYFGPMLKPLLERIGWLIPRKTRSQAMAAATVIRSGEVTPEKNAEIKARKATDRAYRKALKQELEKP